MRTSFLAFTIFALIASSMTAASAFNYAALSGRTVAATIVGDDSAYLQIAYVDTTYDCYVNVDATTGKIDVTWDAGTSCEDTDQTGTGINPNSIYYFHDVLRVTNRGGKDLTGLWLNMSAGSAGQEILIQTQTSSGAMSTDGTYAAAKSYTSLATGNSIYVGFKLDASSLTKTSSPLSKMLTVEARSSD